MVTRYGMVEELGYVAYESPRPAFLDAAGQLQSTSHASPDTQRRIDAAVRTIVMDAFSRTTEVLQQRRTALERGARELLARETLDEAALRAIAAPDPSH